MRGGLLFLRPRTKPFFYLDAKEAKAQVVVLYVLTRLFVTKTIVCGTLRLVAAQTSSTG
ncbi:hypothetical protein H7Y29_03170 [Microbacteriaceae bacterium]|nr:hypothetical protein [Candidatus Saccharibacteria bacterium]